MPDLLLELHSEEIPARMQARAADDLRRLVTDGLVAAGLTYEGARAFATPRRLALTVHGLSARSADLREEKKGPKLGAPEAAIAGFLRSAGLSRIEDARVVQDPKKGSFYIADMVKPGRGAEAVIAALVPEIVHTFPWPKSMRWGAASAPSADGPNTLRWVRPLRSILCTFGPETEDPEVVRFAVGGVGSGDTTVGHRFLSDGTPIRVRRFEDYVAKLERAKVVLDAERRREIIRADAANLAFAQGFQVVEDDGLLGEVAGLVEWPVVLMGSFDAGFLAIPPEVIRLTIRQNQKCFVMTDGAGRLAPKFLLTSNIEAPDGGQAIVAGNERVIAARLSDARFFYSQDLRTPLVQWAEKLKSVTFHEKLGTQWERVERIARLAREIAPLVGADPDEAEEAARLAKADLATGMVGEFPELQGVMGRYYHLSENGLSGMEGAAAGKPSPLAGEGWEGEAAGTNARGWHPTPIPSPQGEGEATLAGAGATDPARVRRVADAICDHYKPAGASDDVPAEPVAIAVALADRLDTLVGFWAIDERPTGSKDPFALRRAALGVVRIVLKNEQRLPIMQLIRMSGFVHLDQMVEKDLRRLEIDARSLEEFGFRYPSYSERLQALERRARKRIDSKAMNASSLSIAEVDLSIFFAERVKAAFREQGSRYDLIDSVLQSRSGLVSLGLPDNVDDEEIWIAPSGEKVFATGSEAVLRQFGFQPAPPDTQDDREEESARDDLLLLSRRVEALGLLLDTNDGKNLLAGAKRAANILRAEEKKGTLPDLSQPVDPSLFRQDEERALHAAIERADAELGERVAAEDFDGAMRALAMLRAPIDAFFDRVTVNADDADLRANRLRLLERMRRLTLRVADFSKIAG